jgi:HD-GYP domain-containing protein (c-di-GMP phosphodiesterase class II)
VRALAAQFAKCSLGGFTFTRPVTTKSLTELLVAFNDAADQDQNAATVMRDRLADLRDLAVELLAQRHLVDDESVQPEINIDPRLFALQTYAKAVIAVKRFVDDAVSQGETKSGARLKLVRIVQDLVDIANGRTNLLLKLVTIRDCTDYQFNHAVNVCVLSIAVGRAIGLKRNDLVDLGMAALMSDLGFAIMSTKPEVEDDSLDAALEAMHEMTLAAVRVLLGKGTLNRSAMRRMIVAFQHHIHYDRVGGHPRVDPQHSLHLFSRIVAICDAYDALTANRPWREAVSPDEALKIIYQGAGAKFDPVLTRIFINLLGMYPVGTVVRLSNGEVGIVYHTTDDPTRFDRPFVKVLRQADGQPMVRTTIRDLTQQEAGKFKLSIVQTLEPSVIGSSERATLMST